MTGRAVGRAPAVVLIDPKFPHNVGGALRACSCWGVGQLFWTGDRVTLNVPRGERLPREERMKGYRDVELYRDAAPLERFASGTPVAVELRPSAESLVDFEHPEDAIYVFGPEDGTLPKGILAASHRFIVIPTVHCLNLAAAVNVVLYDRRLKQHLRGSTRLPALGELAPGAESWSAWHEDATEEEIAAQIHRRSMTRSDP